MQERSALYGLLAENSTDIIIKTDRQGFVLDASPGIGRLGHTMPMLFGPHLRDLVHPAYVDLIAREHAAALAGRTRSDWIEVPLLEIDRRHHWCEVQFSRLTRRGEQAYGVLVVMRSIDARKSLEDLLFTARYTDPLTQLTNRIAFISMLDHLLASDGHGCIALFDLDRFFALNLRYGPSAGDDLICATADLLRAMTRREDIISRVDGERFAVLMPDLALDQSAGLCQLIVETFAAAGTPVLGEDFPVTITVGVSPILRSTDYTLKRAEIALLVAKSKGRSRVETGAEEWPRMLARCA